MHKSMISFVIAVGKGEEFKDWIKRAIKVNERHGISPKLWRVEGRKGSQIIVEFEEFESRADWDAAFEKLSADKEWKDLMKEYNDSGLVLDGTWENFILTDYKA